MLSNLRVKTSTKGFRQYKRKNHNHESSTGGVPKSAASMGKTPASLYTHKVVVPFDGAGRKSWRRVLGLEIRRRFMSLAELAFLTQIILQVYNQHKHLPFTAHPHWQATQQPVGCGPATPGVSGHLQLSMVENRYIAGKIYTYKVRW